MKFQVCLWPHPEFISDPKWYSTNEMEHFLPFYKFPLKPLQQDELWTSWKSQKLGALYCTRFVTCEHAGSVRVWTKLWFALGLKQQALTWISSSLGSEGGQTESSQKQHHPTRTQAEATLCLLPHWAHCLHLFHTFSLGPLFSQAECWKVTGARIDLAGSVSDCVNGWDFPSDRIYLVMMDGS